MRNSATCKHYWKIQSNWSGGHALAWCPHCNSFTAVDRDGVGPCQHSMGQRAGEQLFFGEPPIEKEGSPEYDDILVATAWMDHDPQPHDCADCNKNRAACSEGCQCFLHGPILKVEEEVDGTLHV